MTRLSSTAREKLYDAEAAKARAGGKGNLPICNICGTPIDGVKSAWDESHDPHIPGFMGGEVTGIAHRKCNRLHNNQHDTPLYWKTKRVRQKFIGAKVSTSRLPGGRDSFLKKKLNGQVVIRATGERF